MAAGSRIRILFLFSSLIAVAVGILLIAVKVGAVTVSWIDMFGLSPPKSMGRMVFYNLRLPRAILGFLCGGSLGICGAALQGLFRNPLADPALVGVSGGAALGAVCAIVFGGSITMTFAPMLPLSAFVGALLASLLVHTIALSGGRILISALLLAGIAINALTAAGIGWFVFAASDHQLREFVFWSLGSLAGATWKPLLVCLPFISIAVFLLFRTSWALNTISLGELNAWHMGVPVESVKRSVLVSTALAVGAVTAITGTIAFVGLVAPHLARLLGGADHRFVIPGSFFLGGCLLCLADVVARIAIPPAEVPVGIVVATVGAPLFLILLFRGKNHIA